MVYDFAIKIQQINFGAQVYATGSSFERFGEQIASELCSGLVVIKLKYGRKMYMIFLFIISCLLLVLVQITSKSCFNPMFLIVVSI